MSGPGRKILIVLGTRPEAIKLAPVILELRQLQPAAQPYVCVTAQHRHLLDQVLRTFDIVPDDDLDIMTEDQTLCALAAKILLCMEPVLRRTRPDCVLVQGDTTTATMTAIAAFYAGIPLAHVEGGLRTLSRWDPFPEETNRRIITSIADLHFAPTLEAKANLVQDGVEEDCILVTGNPVIDALQWVTERARGTGDALLDAIPAERRVVLVTAHRRESFGARLGSICDAVLEIARRYDREIEVVWPLHPNPRVRAVVGARLSGVENIRLVEPLDYARFVRLMNRAELILTDSGGIQEEAPALGKPVLVLRDRTERPEGLEAGTARLVGTDPGRIVRETCRLLTDRAAYAHMARVVHLYGDGKAAGRIAAALIAPRPLGIRGREAPVTSRAAARLAPDRGTGGSSLQAGLARSRHRVRPQQG